MNNLSTLRNGPFTTPVLFLIFNRADTASKVFSAIRDMKPTKLYIVADGPRATHPGDVEKCKAARDVVADIDWDCDVKKLFREENFGCGKGPASAITWFFENETEGIILEDDCLPSPSFFYFCSELLERYRDDTRIMEIGGNNFEPESARRGEYSYYFSERTYIWGWATWRRAWKYFDYEMKCYPEIRDKGYLDGYYDHAYEQEHYDFIHEKMFKGDRQLSRKTVWDYQWQFVMTINSGLIIVPERNLVINLGFGSHATNTSDPKGAGHNLKSEEIPFPLKHPKFMMADHRRDLWYFKYCCSSRASRIRSMIKNLIPAGIFKMALPHYQALRRALSHQYLAPGTSEEVML